MTVNLSDVQKSLDWLKTKIFLNAKAGSAARRTVKRGQVYRCNFGVGIGSEMQKDRPAVIIQNDVGNANSGNTIVIPITHDTATLPCVANITPQVDANGALILDGQANASNMACVSKARLGDLVCTLTPTDMKNIDIAVAKALALMSYYADLSKKLGDKIQYINQIKKERNEAQDELSRIRQALKLNDEDDIVEYIERVEKKD